MTGKQSFAGYGNESRSTVLVGKFILDPCVKGELWAIWEFIAKDNPDAASRVVEAAYQTFKKIAASPEMGMRRKF